MKQHNPQFLKLATAAKKEVKEITVKEAHQLIQKNPDLELIDVREESEFSAGHLPGAKNLSKGIIERDIEKAVPNNRKTLLLYCGGGFRSALASVNLKKMGYENVISMDGGYTGWVEAGLPTEKE